MKRIQRINRVSRKRPPRQSKFLPVVLIIAGLGALLQVLFVGVLVTAAGAGAAKYYRVTTTDGLKRLKQSPNLQNVQPTRILDRHGKELWRITDPSHGLQINVPFSKIPPAMRDAIISSEDKNFYSEAGIDPLAIARSAYEDVRYHGVYTGASTITQQLVKMLVVGNQRTAQRKIQEVLIAYAMAQPHSGFTKDEILRLYLNNAYFSHNATGVEAAAQVYFGKHIWQLDVAQCALLAGLVQLPGYYDPLLGPNHRHRALERTAYVLGRMKANGYLSMAQYHAALAESARFKFSQPHLRVTTSKSLAPYWTDWITHLLTYPDIPQVNWYTNPQLAAIVANHGGFTSGLTIRTTLDLNMYRHAEQIMNQRVSEIAYNNVQDAAVVTLDPKTAECLAMVGGLNYDSNQSGSRYNMAAQPRSPGSSFKPFTYVTAFEKGWYPAKMILDEPKTWPDPQPGDPYHQYAPVNYDKAWHGAVTVRMALANSYNMPAVKTVDFVGPDNAVNTAVSMGVWYLRNLKDAPLSVTLGSKEVPLWQMAQAYNTFANGGVFRPMASILSIQDASGRTIYTYKPPVGVQVLAPQFAYQITSILKDNYARVPAFGPNSVLQLDRPAAVKTGTSQDFRDNLTIGYTPNLLTATWVGNPDETVMNNVEGVDGAGPIWHDMMEWSSQYLTLPVKDFAPPPGVMLETVSSASSDSATGYLVSRNTAWPITDVFAAGEIPHQYDPGYGPGYDNYMGYRVLGGYNFSLDGGTTQSLAGAGSSAPGVGATQPYSTTNGAPNTANGPGSGFSGTVTYNPGSHSNICGGRSYTYNGVYVNGQLVYRYVCQ